MKALPQRVGLSVLDTLLWFASAVTPIVIIGRVIHERLYTKPFAAFVWMLAIGFLRDGALAALHYGSHLYVLVWQISLPILLILQLYAGFATLNSVARLYRRFGNFVTRLCLLCLVLTLISCCVILPFELHHFDGDEVILRALFLAQRWVATSVTGTLSLVALFLLRSPAPPKQPPQNLVRHTILLTLYFGGYSFLFFVENVVSLGAAQLLERLQFTFVIVLYVLWATCLSRKGQRSDAWADVTAISFRRMQSA